MRRKAANPESCVPARAKPESAEEFRRHSPPHRIAIVHYTAPPEIGGVESLVAAQSDVLREQGCSVRLIAAAGGDCGAPAVHLPLLHPADERVLAARRTLPTSLPPPDHPLVREIALQLSGAVAECEQCWVHNAFTMFLNPFLSIAVHLLSRTMTDVRWVAWCEDVSVASRHWPFLSSPERSWVNPGSNVLLVTISEARRYDLANALGCVPDSIRVIRPPLNLLEWIDAGAETRAVVDRTHLFERDPVIFVPEKLLPHKNLVRAVELASALRARDLRPLVLVSGAHSPHDHHASAETLARLQASVSHADLEDAYLVLSQSLGEPPTRRTVRELMLLSDLIFLPSEEEGFGMPILEAQSLRAPVLCSDISAFRDAGGSAACYFPLDAPMDCIADQVMRICESQPGAARLAAARSYGRFETEIRDLVSHASRRQ